MPDEVNYDPETTPPDRTRQLCNVWKADRALADDRPLLAHRRVRRGARRRARAAADPGQRDLEAAVGQGAALPPGRRVPRLPRPEEHDDLLDGARRHGGRHGDDLLRARLQPLAAGRPRAGSSTRPTTGSRTSARRCPTGAELELVPIEVPAGGAAFHDGWTFHGSPANERADAERRAIISHTVSSADPLERERHAAPDLLEVPAARASASSTTRSSRRCKRPYRRGRSPPMTRGDAAHATHARGRPQAGPRSAPDGPEPDPAAAPRRADHARVPARAGRARAARDLGGGPGVGGHRADRAAARAGARGDRGARGLGARHRARGDRRARSSCRRPCSATSTTSSR